MGAMYRIIPISILNGLMVSYHSNYYDIFIFCSPLVSSYHPVVNYYKSMHFIPVKHQLMSAH